MPQEEEKKKIISKKDANKHKSSTKTKQRNPLNIKVKTSKLNYYQYFT